MWAGGGSLSAPKVPQDFDWSFLVSFYKVEVAKRQKEELEQKMKEGSESISLPARSPLCQTGGLKRGK